MKGKSPMMKALIGNQGNLPAELKAKILASPATMKKEQGAAGDKKTERKLNRINKKMQKQHAKQFDNEDKGTKRGDRRADKAHAKGRKLLAKGRAIKKASIAKMAKKSPAKAKTEKAKKLLKAVPNKEAYDKLSDTNKKGFDKAAKKAGLPTKKVPLKLKKNSPTKQTANRDKPKTSLTDKIKKGAKKLYKETVPPVIQKVNKKLINAVTGGKGKTKTKAKTFGKSASSSASEVLSEKITLKNLKKGTSKQLSPKKGMKTLKGNLDVQVSKKRNIKRKLQTKSSGVTESKPSKPSKPSVERMARTKAAKSTLNQKNKARRDKQKKFLKKNY